MPLLSLLLLYTVVLAQAVHSAVIEHDFNITWVWANPDGAFPRPVIGINGQFPLPQINASVGDTVVIDVLNSLGNQSTSLHFHGLFMNGTSHMDGTTFASQCAIGPGSTFRYRFTTQQPGTYWYHSHTKAQYPDGLRGLLVVSDPQSPFRSRYDEEISLTISDWYHDQTTDLMEKYDQGAKHMPMDPAPDASLINDAHDSKIHVQPGKTYLIRLANIGGFISQYFWIEGHVMRVVEVDGVYTEEAETSMLYLAVGQRYSFLLTAKSDATVNYPMTSRVDSSTHSTGMTPDIAAHGWLVYDETKSLPAPSSSTELFVFNDSALVPFDREPLFENVDQKISLVIEMETGKDGIVHWMFNTAHYEPPEIPSMFTAVTSGADATDPKIYGSQVQPWVLDHNKVIEVTVKNGRMMDHPIHLHGHNFQVVERSVASSDQALRDIPMRRDTIIVRKSETLKIRFRADNPGVWLLHCHMEWHAYSGLMATIVEAPLALQQQPIGLKLQSAEGIHKACPSEQILDEGEVETGQNPGSTQKTIETIFGVLALFAGLAAAAFGAWKIYRTRCDKNQDYLLVPLEEAEDSVRKYRRLS